AREPQQVELGMVRSAEPAHRGETLAERADDEIDLVGNSGLLGDAPPGGTEHADRMRLVEIEIGPVLALDLRKLGERGDIAEHAVEALDDHQLVAAGPADSFQPLVEVARRVVPEADDS